MSLFLFAGYTCNSSFSADSTVVENKKEENMEKLINNAPFTLVLVFLIIDFVLLIKGADFFVEGSSSVAKRLHVPYFAASTIAGTYSCDCCFCCFVHLSF